MSDTDVTRVNGWDCPPTKRQVTAITLVFVNAGLCGSLVVPILSDDNLATLMVSVPFTIFFIVLTICAGTVMTINPVDRVVGGEESESEDELGTKTQFLYCGYCRSNVNLDSKHCWECGKCVENYDHHCPWLNTCIGDKNYSFFFVSVWSLLFMLACVCVGAGIILVEALWGFEENIYGMSQASVVVISSGILLVNIPLFFLDTTLVGFHCYLVYEGITTYEHLRPDSAAVKNKQERRRAARDAQPRKKWCSWRQSGPKQKGKTPEAAAVAVGYQPVAAVTAAGAASLSNAGPSSSSVADVEVNVDSSTDSGDSDSAESNGTAETGWGSVYRAMHPREESSDFNKEVASVVFGSLKIAADPAEKDDAADPT